MRKFAGQAVLTFLAASLGIGLSSAAHAGSITFTESSGTLSASASFDLNGSTLSITLTNTSSAAVTAPNDVLTGVFFTTPHALTPLSASLNGSTVLDGTIPKDVGAGWQYKFFTSNGPHGMDSGISAAGLGLFGPTGNFYSTGAQLGGIDYGIVSAENTASTGNGGIKNGGPLIKDSVKFNLSVPTGFSLSDLGSQIVFQYGTNLSELSVTTNNSSSPVPEPASMTLWLTGVVGLVLARRFKRA